MQSNALPAFDDEHWRSLTQDMRWLPDPSDGDYDYNQFMDFEQPEFYDAPTSTAGFGALDKAEYLDQWSAYSSQQAAPEPTLISVSSVFNLDRLDADGSLPDFDLVANDGVHFAVNAAKLRASSFSEFGGMAAYARLGAAVPLSSTILNLLLHAVYGLSATSYSPTLDDLATTIDALERYGLSKETLVCLPESPLFEAILRMAPSQPLECYSLAAHAGLDELAIAVSPYTLSISLPDVVDEKAEHMGASYLRRLFFLHLGRLEALKRVLRPPPTSHPPTEDCDGFAEQPLREPWLKKVAEILWTAHPNISTISLETRLNAVGKETDCPECLHHLDHRIMKLVAEWSHVKNTI